MYIHNILHKQTEISSVASILWGSLAQARPNYILQHNPYQKVEYYGL